MEKGDSRSAINRILTVRNPHDFELTFTPSKTPVKILITIAVVGFIASALLAIYLGARLASLCFITFALLSLLAQLLSHFARSRGLQCDTAKRTFTLWRQFGDSSPLFRSLFISGQHIDDTDCVACCLPHAT